MRERLEKSWVVEGPITVSDGISIAFLMGDKLSNGEKRSVLGSYRHQRLRHP